MSGGRERTGRRPASSGSGRGTACPPSAAHQMRDAPATSTILPARESAPLGRGWAYRPESRERTGAMADSGHRRPFGQGACLPPRIHLAAIIAGACPKAENCLGFGGDASIRRPADNSPADPLQYPASPCSASAPSLAPWRAPRSVQQQFGYSAAAFSNIADVKRLVDLAADPAWAKISASNAMLALIADD